MKKTIYSLATAILASSFAFAQDSTKTGKFTISGYIDSYYQTAFNNPMSNNVGGISAQANATTNTPAVLGIGRAFDKVANQFALGLVQTKFMYTNRNSEMVMDLVFGPNAALGNFGHIPSLTGYESLPSSAGYKNSTSFASMAIKQAYFKYNMTSKFSFTVGQFGTHIGYEVIDAPINYNYSLSNQFNNGPFYHVGLKFNYNFSDKFGIMAGVVNNWDNIYDWKKQKSIVAQLFVSPVKGLNVYVNYIGGFNDDMFKVSTTAASDTTIAAYNANVSPSLVKFSKGYVRNLVDLTVGFQATSKFYVGLNASYGWYNGLVGATKSDGITPTNFQSWYGIAGYANYQFTSFLGLGVRYEHFNDRNGLRYIGRINNGLTITLPITLSDGHIILKPEFRTDAVSSNDLYIKGDGSYTPQQSTIGMAFIYKY